jgi:hypothetical protein
MIISKEIASPTEVFEAGLMAITTEKDTVIESGDVTSTQTN